MAEEDKPKQQIATPDDTSGESDAGETPEIPVSPRPAASPEKPKSSPLANIDKETLIAFLSDMIDTLNFKRVALVALLVAIGLVLYSLYENREAIVTKLTGPVSTAPIDSPIAKPWVLSANSKTQLQALAASTQIGFILISDVDLRKNRRAVRYSYIKDKSIVLSPQIQQMLTLPLPVFDYDPLNTEQMVAVLSNEFRCDPYKSTIYFRHAPEMADKFQTICRMAIPPFVGQFVGFLTVGITGPVAPAELDSIRLEVSRIAVDIYYNDVMKTQAPAPSTR